MNGTEKQWFLSLIHDSCIQEAFDSHVEIGYFLNCFTSKYLHGILIWLFSDFSLRSTIY